MQTRRTFMKNAAMATAAATTGTALLGQPKAGSHPVPPQEEDLFFKLSLAEWSLMPMLRRGDLDNLDFPAYARDKFDIHAVEYVDQFFPSADLDYAKQLLQRTEDIGVKNVLIMIDTAGSLGLSDETKRMEAVENHYKWVECAQLLGCHAIRVNARGDSDALAEDVAYHTVKSLRTLAQFAADYGISVIVENHGGFSSRASWLVDVIHRTGMMNCGVLPDFGNFVVDRNPGGERYDLYLGVKELMPLAKGVSGKSHNFDEEGNEVDKDYYRLLQIIKDSGFRGYIDIEYEGRELSPDEGIIATKKLLIKAGKTVT
ncbi:MAG: sugar phosphate isomerase/epimerase family protein [Bacteroidales bacterium]